ncbi:LysR family transcriptional regulator [uncultured Paracoccus sp.]|uniref:LysR family transcriptional regulator n=1 Tax=uncultured Paracoccus sp. TaxID=189685 RepID=UPI002630B12B|nr:LysR family transcriptional regulator [uncultured Paracoccus sp.]
MITLAHNDIRLLRVFHCVTVEKGFAPAAAKLGLSEAAVSRAMSDLEARIGLRLCRRGRGGFGLEQNGEFVLKATQRLLGEMDFFSETLNIYRRGLAGELRLAITESTLSDRNNQISGLIARYKLRAPAVRIELSVLPPDGVSAQVRDGQAHIGFLPVQKRSEDLTYRELYEERMSLYCSQGHPFFGRECTQEDIHAAEIAAPDYLTNEGLGDHDGKLQIVSRTNSIEGIAMLIMTGSYLGFLPDHMASAWVERGQLQELLPEFFGYHTRFYAISHPRREASPMVQSFLRELS